MLDINELSGHLELRDGIWCSKKNSAVSYNEVGHANCFQVEDNSFWFIHRNNCIQAVVEKFPPLDGTVLDVGGGNGVVSRALEVAGLDAVLVEPGLSGVQNALKRGIKNIIHSSFQDAKFKNDLIPSIGLFDVLEHVEKDKQFMQDIYAAMRSNGRLYMTVPAHKALWSKHDVLSGHYRRYNKTSLREVVEAVGFEVEYISYFFSVLVVPNFLLRSIPTFLGLNNNADDLREKKSHHINSESLPNKILSYIWRRELQVIQRSGQIFLGNSCVLVAKK